MYKLTTTGWSEVVTERGKVKHALYVPTEMVGASRKELQSRFDEMAYRVKSFSKKDNPTVSIISCKEMSDQEYEEWKALRDAKWVAKAKDYEETTKRSTLDTGTGYTEHDCVAMHKIHENVLKRRD